MPIISRRPLRTSKSYSRTYLYNLVTSLIVWLECWWHSSWSFTFTWLLTTKLPLRTWRRKEDPIRVFMTWVQSTTGIKSLGQTSGYGLSQCSAEVENPWATVSIGVTTKTMRVILHRSEESRRKVYHPPRNHSTRVRHPKLTSWAWVEEVLDSKTSCFNLLLKIHTLQVSFKDINVPLFRSWCLVWCQSSRP